MGNQRNLNRAGDRTEGQEWAADRGQGTEARKGDIMSRVRNWLVERFWEWVARESLHLFSHSKAYRVEMGSRAYGQAIVMASDILAKHAWFCPYCDEVCSTKFSLKRHIGRKHGSENRTTSA